jgi:hypothetical protein
MGMSMPKSELNLENDPFLRLGKSCEFFLIKMARLGFGMNAYFEIIEQLIYMMVFISIVTIPAMYIYSSYNALEPYTMFDNLTLGNMGGSSISCGQAALSVPGAVLSLQCVAGTIQSLATTSDGSLAF